MSTERTVEKSAVKTEQAARQTAVAAVQTKDSAERRTELAADRTVLAAERTYAAWVRTGLVALASGIGARKLLEGLVPDWMIVGTATILVAFSAFCYVAAVWRQILTDPAPPDPDIRRLPRFVLLLVNGFLTMVAIAALFGLWFGRLGAE